MIVKTDWKVFSLLSFFIKYVGEEVQLIFRCRIPEEQTKEYLNKLHSSQQKLVKFTTVGGCLNNDHLCLKNNKNFQSYLLRNEWELVVKSIS